jgi:hypothetical protein
MNSRQGSLLLVGFIASASVLLSGCASGRKQKFEQREKLAASSGLYCDFINGDKNKEVELELNLMMANKCDSEKNFSITNYKTPAEVTGVLYCCSIKRPEKLEKPAMDIKPTTFKSPAARPEPPPKAVAPNTATSIKNQATVDRKPTPAQNKKTTPKNDLEEDIDVPL